ncbi:MAG TPA: histidine phosphatase family protein [bacterium]|nr:histidine phosphatase family protein [bacterium]
MTQLFLIRHGETAWNRKKRYQGQTDISLTQDGRDQARDMARALKSVKIDMIYSSSLKRARQTALILSKEVGVRPVWDARLRELHFGAWEGRTAEQLRSRKDPVFLKWQRGNFVTPTGGESMASLRKRIRSFLKSILSKANGKQVVVVSHAGPMKVLIFESLKLPLRSLWSMQIDPASISMLSFHKHFVQMNYLNAVVPPKGTALQVFRK